MFSKSSMWCFEHNVPQPHQDLRKDLATVGMENKQLLRTNEDGVGV